MHDDHPTDEDRHPDDQDRHRDDQDHQDRHQGLLPDGQDHQDRHRGAGHRIHPDEDHRLAELLRLDADRWNIHRDEDRQCADHQAAAEPDGPTRSSDDQAAAEPDDPTDSSDGAEVPTDGTGPRLAHLRPDGRRPEARGSPGQAGFPARDASSDV